MYKFSFIYKGSLFSLLLSYLIKFDKIAEFLIKISLKYPMDDEDTVACVIDNGSYMCKAGISGEDAPKRVFPTIVGRPKVNKVGADQKDTYFGDEAMMKRSLLNLSHPIQNGSVNSWEDMSKIWGFCFN